jgi:hypothetical protein
VTALEFLRTTRVWDPIWDLPLFPGHNPHIYLAYTQQVLKLRGETLSEVDYRYYYWGCEVEEGLFRRAPETWDPITSHDEIMGACALDQEVARRVVGYLRRSRGYFNPLEPKPRGLREFFRFNVLRMLWMWPFLRTCAGERIGLFWQLVWCLRVLLGHFQLDSSKHGPKARLMNWLMADQMVRYRPCHWVWNAYRKALVKRGFKLDHELSQEPDDVPRGQSAVLSAIAPEEFTLPSELEVIP